MLRLRQAELAARYQEFLTNPSADEVVGEVFAVGDRGLLLELQARDADGEDIGNELLRMGIDRPMFRRLIAYLALIDGHTELSVHERDDLAHLLVQAWKKRVRYADWRNEESLVGPQKLWPNYFSRYIDPAADPAWVPGNFKTSFLPWRGSAQRRSDLEMRLGGRLRAWQAAGDTLEQAVSDAQRVALPVLRDGLLAFDRSARCSTAYGYADRAMADGLCLGRCL